MLVGLTDGQKRALRLADNKIALGANWDLDLLKLEFGDLAGMNFDLGLTGFSVGEIDIALLGANDPDDDHLPGHCHVMVLLRFSGELIAHSRPAISKWTGLW